MVLRRIRDRHPRPGPLRRNSSRVRLQRTNSQGQVLGLSNNLAAAKSSAVLSVTKKGIRKRLTSTRKVTSGLVMTQAKTMFTTI
jgi:hypothetical protein